MPRPAGGDTAVMLPLTGLVAASLLVAVVVLLLLVELARPEPARLHRDRRRSDRRPRR